MEECFQAGKNEAGLDHYQVRLYKAWYRYVTLAMLALAWLAVTRAALADPTAGRRQPGHLGQRDPPHVHRALRPACPTSSTPAAGHDGATATRNAPAAATTSDNAARSLSAAGVLSTHYLARSLHARLTQHRRPAPPRCGPRRGPPETSVRMRTRYPPISTAATQAAMMAIPVHGP